MSTVVIIITIMKKLIFFNFRMGMKKREAGERRGVFSVKTKKKKKNSNGQGFCGCPNTARDHRLQKP
jgi:hypothetical protein